MPTAARSDADRLALRSAVCTTALVRSQISVGLCSTQPALGRICSCSNWCRPISLPPWSKIMNLVLVVPWSTAPTKSAMVRLFSSLTSGSRFELLGGGGHFTRFLWAGRRQEPADQELVRGHADDAADDRTDDRYPEIEIVVLV